MSESMQLYFIQMLSIVLIMPLVIPQILPDQNKKSLLTIIKTVIAISLMLLPIVFIYPSIRIFYMVLVLFITGHIWLKFNLNQSLWFSFSTLGVFLLSEVLVTTLLTPIFASYYHLSDTTIALNLLNLIAIVLVTAVITPFISKPIKRLLSDKAFLKTHQITMPLVFITIMVMMILFVTLITNDVFQYTANPVVVFMFYILLIGGALVSVFFVDKYYKKIYELNQFKERLSSIRPQLEKSNQFLISVEYDIASASFINNTFDKYQIEKMIYSGRNSKIYLLKQPESLEKLTLKAIEKTQEIQYDFSTLLNLRHSNLSPVLDWGEGEHYNYIIKPFIKGIDAQRKVEQYGPFEVEEVKRIILKLANVLNYMHSQDEPIIYRDLKPSNIILGEANEVILIDIESVRSINENKTSDTFIIGTKGYASPEQYGFSQSSPLSDVYGLGATAFFLLTGNVPDLKEVEQIDENNRGELYGRMILMIQKCMKFGPDQRYQNIKEIIDFLDK